MEEKKTQFNIPYYFFCYTIPKLTKLKNLYKTITLLKFNINTNNYEKS